MHAQITALPMFMLHVCMHICTSTYMHGHSIHALDGQSLFVHIPCNTCVMLRGPLLHVVLHEWHEMLFSDSHADALISVRVSCIHHQWRIGWTPQHRRRPEGRLRRGDICGAPMWAVHARHTHVLRPCAWWAHPARRGRSAASHTAWYDVPICPHRLWREHRDTHLT